MPFPERNTEQDRFAYLYNGKELDEMTGLYYYGARYYDPRDGIFLGVDRFAENYPNLSPYHYCANNPICFVDVNGDSIRYANNGAFWNIKARLHISLGAALSKEFRTTVRNLKADDNIHLIKNGKKIGKGTFTRTEAKDNWLNSKPNTSDYDLINDFESFSRATDLWSDSKPSETIGSCGNETNTVVYLDLSKEFKNKVKVAWKQYNFNTNLKVATGHDLYHAYKMGIGKYDYSLVNHVTASGDIIEYKNAENNALNSEKKITSDMNKWRIFNKIIPRENYNFNR